jgi:hypothetical protein
VPVHSAFAGTSSSAIFTIHDNSQLLRRSYFLGIFIIRRIIIIIEEKIIEEKIIEEKIIRENNKRK